MSKLGELYATRHLSGDMSLDYACWRLKTPALKEQFCAWLVDRMVFSDVLAGQQHPPVSEASSDLYPAVRSLLKHRYLQRYTTKLVFDQCESHPAVTAEILRRVCDGDHEACLALVSWLDQQRNPHSEKALRLLLEAESESVWLDAAITIKTKKKLYHFTKWHCVLRQLPRRQRGQILEEELGL